MGYTSIQALRDEGITVSQADDTRLATLIELASRMIDRFCGQFFEPRTLTLLLDGNGTKVLKLGMPICTLDSVELIGTPDDLYDPDDYQVYNRHLTQGLLDPDDRMMPRIELYSSSLTYARDRIYRTIYQMTSGWPSGKQNLRVKGTFGYTDPDPAGGVGTQANLTCANAGPYVLANGQTLLVTIDGGKKQTITFATADFANIAAATAAEVAAAVNKTITGASAVVASGKIKLVSDRPGSGSSILIDAASTATALGFSMTTASGTGNGWGLTPLLIARACQLIIVKQLLRKATDVRRYDDLLMGRLRREKTRDQEYEIISPGRDSFSAAAMVADYTGDPEIDNILDLFRRPQRVVGV